MLQSMLQQIYNKCTPYGWGPTGKGSGYTLVKNWLVSHWSCQISIIATGWKDLVCLFFVEETFESSCEQLTTLSGYASPHRPPFLIIRCSFGSCWRDLSFSRVEEVGGTERGGINNGYSPDHTIGGKLHLPDHTIKGEPDSPEHTIWG